MYEKSIWPVLQIDTSGFLEMFRRFLKRLEIRPQYFEISFPPKLLLKPFYLGSGPGNDTYQERTKKKMIIVGY